MDINRGDRLDYLVSVESDDFVMAKKASELATSDPDFKEFVGLEYRGNMNTTVIRTVQGRTIVLQHDASTPSPHNLIHGNQRPNERLFHQVERISVVNYAQRILFLPKRAPLVNHPLLD